jgi:hypothetical protein
LLAEVVVAVAPIVVMHLLDVRRDRLRTEARPATSRPAVEHER